MKIQRARGTRDFKPEEKIVRQEIVDLLRSVFEKYGYNPIETPILERYEVLSAKFGAGEESDVLKETFRLKDQGDRELGLRFDLTVPLARFVAMNPNLKMPFKRYQIGRTYRDGPVKLGRLREFWQCDVDVVGSSSMLAEAELMSLVKDVFSALNFDFIIELNNRKFLQGLFEEIGIKNKEEVMVIIDKLKKVGFDEVKKELEKILDKEKVTKLLFVLDVSGTNEEKVDALLKVAKNDKTKEGLNEIKQIFDYSKFLDVTEIEFVPSLVRGLAYYTGPIFEVFLKNSKIKSSFAGGGRYDNLISNYSGSKENIPATGISFGLEALSEEILSGKEAGKKSVVDVYVIPIRIVNDSLKVIKQLRDAGINADMDINGRSISKNLDFCDKLGIPYVVFVGQKEIDKGKVKLRDMKSGKEELLTMEDVINILRK